jgi:hypothetical protein
MPGCDIGQLGGHRGAPAEGEHGDALGRALALTRADHQAPDPHRHVAEQGAEPRPAVSLARQPAPARRARARALAQSGHLCRHDLGPQRRREPLRRGETEPELGQGGLLVTLDAGELGLGGHARVPLRHQLHPPHQLRHRPALAS